MPKRCCITSIVWFRGPTLTPAVMRSCWSASFLAATNPLSRRSWIGTARWCSASVAVCCTIRTKPRTPFKPRFLCWLARPAVCRRPETLAAFLHGTARRLALASRRAATRRRQHEREAVPPAPSVEPLDELSARELFLALDEEMARLPETYRLPLLLCGLEGRSQEEAARLLGWTPGSVKGRLERGRARLHARLTRRGLTFSAALLALGVSQGGSASADERLTAGTLRAASAFTGGDRGAIAASILTLADSGIAPMTATKVKLGLALLLATSVLAGAGTLATKRPPTASNEPEKPAAERESRSAPATDKHSGVDQYGDPLPAGAVARLGTIRLRHGGHVMSVAFTPDGKTVVSGGYDGWAFQWDTATGKRLRHFRQAAIDGVAISPDSRTVALASGHGNSIRLYDLTTSKELANCLGHRSGTQAVVFSPDGKQLVSGGKDKRIRLWNAVTLREVRSWEADRECVRVVRFTPDGKSVVSLGSEEKLRFWDPATGTERLRRGVLSGVRVRTFAFFADGKTLVTGSNTAPGLIQLWDAARGKEIRTVARHPAGIGPMVLAADEKSVWASAYEGDVRQWDLATGKQLHHLDHPRETIFSLAMSPDGKRLVSGGHDHSVILWDTATGRRMPDFEGHRNLVTSIAFTPDGRSLWTGGYDHTLRLWKIASGEQLRRISTKRDDDMAYSMAVSPESKLLAIAVVHLLLPFNKPGCDVRIWDVRSGKEREPLHGHQGHVHAVAFSPDGRTLASRGADHTIRLWDLATGKEAHRMNCRGDRGHGLSFSPDGLVVVSLLDEETVGFWDVDKGQLIRQVRTGKSSGNNFPLLSPDGRTLVTGGGDQPLRGWETASGKARWLIERTPRHLAYTVIALSSDSRILASTEYGKPIELWSGMTGQKLGDLRAGDLAADILALLSLPAVGTWLRPIRTGRS